MTAPVPQDPLAGYTADWRRRVGRPAAADAQDPLADYTPGWRDRLKPMRAAPITVTAPAPPPPPEEVQALRRPMTAAGADMADLGFMQAHSPAVRGIERGLANVAVGAVKFPFQVLGSTVFAPPTPDELRNPLVRARLRANGQDPDAMLHQAIRETATGERASPTEGLKQLGRGALTMGADLQSAAMPGPNLGNLIYDAATGRQSADELIAENPQGIARALEPEHQIQSLTELVGNAFLFGAGGEEGPTAKLGVGERVRTGLREGAAAVRAAPGRVRELVRPRAPEPAPAPVERRAAPAATRPDLEGLIGTGPESMTPEALAATQVIGQPEPRTGADAIANEAARLSARVGPNGEKLPPLTEAQRARLRELSAQLGEAGRTMESPPPVEASAFGAESTAPVPAVRRITAEEIMDRHMALAEGPGTIYRVPTQSIHADPARFQFKEAGPAGVTGELKNVRQYNPQLAGVISVWRDPADGRIYVVNGHHRLELAQRFDVPDMHVQFLKAADARAARAEGAFINMAEGRGTATDVAKFLRDFQAGPEALEARGVSLRGDLARDGVALSRLAPDIFDQIATGKAPQGWGVAIGELLDDAALQREALAAARSARKRLSQAEVTEIARQVRDAGTEAVNQETLFGTETERHALFANRAQLATALKQRLSTDRRLFGYVSKEGRAGELSRAGSTQIDVEAARHLAESAGRTEEIFDRLYTRTGPIAELVHDGAQRIARGERPSAVAADLYPAVSDAVGRELAAATGGTGPGGGEREVPAGERPAPADVEAPLPPDSPESLAPETRPTEEGARAAPEAPEPPIVPPGAAGELEAAARRAQGRAQERGIAGLGNKGDPLPDFGAYGTTVPQPAGRARIVADRIRSASEADRPALLRDAADLRDEMAWSVLDNEAVAQRRIAKDGPDSPGVKRTQAAIEEGRQEIAVLDDAMRAAGAPTMPEVPGRPDLPRLREELRLTKDPHQRMILASRIASLEKLVNRGQAIGAQELATEAAARAPDATPATSPDQMALFSPIVQGTPLGERLRRLIKPKAAEVVEVKALIDISRRLAEALDVPLRQGRIGARNAAGVFFPHAEVTRVRRFDALDTVAHEAGHFVSKKYLRNPTMRSAKFRGQGRLPTMLPKDAGRELVRMGRDLYGDRKPAGGYGEEGIAEWFSFYVTEPHTLAEKAPVFTRHMEGILAQEPVLKNAFDQARQDFADHAAASWAQRIDAGMSVNERVRFKPTVRSLMYNWLDNVYEFKAAMQELGREVGPSQDAYVLARLTRGSAGVAEEMLARGVVKYGTHERAAPSLEHALMSVPPERIQQLRRYLDGESSLDRWKRGESSLDRWKRDIDPGTTKADAQGAVDAYGKDPVLRPVAEAIWAHYRALIEYKRDAGLLTPEQATRILETNPHHVSFYRLFDESEKPAYGSGGSGRGYTRTSSGVKRQKGSARRKIDVLESVFTDTYQTVAQVKKYEVAREMIRAARGTEGGGRLIEEVPTPRQPVTIPIERIRDQLAELGFAPPGGQSVAEWISQPEMQAILTAFEDVRFPRAAEAKDLVVPLLDEGKVKFYAVKDRGLYDAMQGLGTPQLEGWRRWLSVPVRTLRAGATLTLEFAFGRNPVRDAWGSAVYSNAAFRPPGWRLSEGLFHLLKADDVFQAWRLEGGENAAQLGLDRVGAQKTLAKLLRTRTLAGKTVELVRHPLDTLRLASAILESASRIGEYAAVSREAVGRGTTLPNARAEAALASRDVTIDFAQGGQAAKEINNLVWTFNAALRGTAQLFREVKTRGKVVVPRALALITLPSIALYLLQKDDPEYQDMPAWVRNTAWVYIQRGDDKSSTPDANNPKGWDGYGTGKVKHRWILPKPFELGVVFGTAPERMVEWVDKKKPAALRHMRDALVQAFAPPIVPTAVAPLIENYANRSFRSGRSIVPRGREDFPPAEQTGAFTTETSQRLGRALNYSPAKIDNLVRGYTGGLGQYVTSAADAALRVASGEAPPETAAGDPLAHIPLLRAFVRRGVANDAESVNEFYRAFDEAEAHRRAWHAYVAAGNRAEAADYLAAHRQAIRSVATAEETGGAPGPLRVVYVELQKLQQLRRRLNERDETARSQAVAEAIRRGVRRVAP